jgi:DsbC/DsbD-like thiol-disulfide interchange protein
MSISASRLYQPRRYADRHVPVTDSWGEAAPDLSGKTLSLVLADSGQAPESRGSPSVQRYRTGWR